MDSLRQYVICVVTAALICAILTGLMENAGGKVLIKLLCGLFLTVTAIRPILDIDFEQWIESSFPYYTEADQAAFAGEKMAGEAISDIIKAESEAYILDKAAGLNAAITAEVIVSEENIPMEATISGEISPYAKARLGEILETDLGITKENQQWTG